MKNQPIYLTLIALMGFVFLVNCSGRSKSSDETPTEKGKSVALELVTEGLESPVEMAVPNDGTKRLFIAEQKGSIKVIENGKLLVTPFLSLSSKMVEMNDRYTERGLLGLAFHPQYKTNGKFYVYYSAPSSAAGSDHKSIIAEYTVSSDPNVANTTEKIIMEIEQPQSNHNGGHMEFGPDGYLYIGLGDGGGAGDEHGSIGNGQNLNTVLGKIIRIDVNSGNPYAIPADNPFNGANQRKEIWAYGLRNPWKFSFDKKNTGRLFCADVGQNKYEEINIIEKGKNYGWRIMEATHCYNPATNCDQTGLTLPIYEYDHDVGISVTGGIFYSGDAIPALIDKYVFADWTGVFFTLTGSGNSFTGEKITVKNKPENLRVLSFGEDFDHNVYVLTSLDTQPMSPTGAVYRFVASD